MGTAVCQFLLGKVLRVTMVNEAEKLNKMCQFLLGKVLHVKKFVKETDWECQFLLGKVLRL